MLFIYISSSSMFVLNTQKNNCEICMHSDIYNFSDQKVVGNSVVRMLLFRILLGLIIFQFCIFHNL